LQSEKFYRSVKCSSTAFVVWASLTLGALGAYAAPASDPSEYQPVINTYCVSCHNEKLKTAELMLDKADLKNVPQGAAVWEKVIRKLRAGTMPPLGLPRPDAKVYDAFASSLETSLDRAALAHPNPGRPALHRLNRAEYQNAIRDVLALDIDATQLLPPDDSSHGFDNVADTLGISPSLLDRYMSAATQVSQIAVGDPQISPSVDIIVDRATTMQTDHVEGLPLGTRGGLLVQKTFPVDGQYQIRAKLRRSNLGFMRGIYSPDVVVFTVDGQEVFRTTVATDDDYKAMIAGPVFTDQIEARLNTRIPIKAGPRVIGVTFIQKSEAQRQTLLKPMLAAGDAVDSDGPAKIDSVQISGPYDVTGRGDTPSRRRIFTCHPSSVKAEASVKAGASAKDEEACAKTILSTLARNAWRRPVADPEVQPLLDFYRTGRKNSDFDGGIELALRRLLADPAFIFRAERDPAKVAVGEIYRISDLELASRLSFFLWSTVPDRQLIDVASQGKLRNPEVLNQQVRRMLADSKSDAFINNFSGQWLQLRNLKRVSPDPTEYLDFDDSLRQAMETETEMLFASVVRGDRPVLELLTADYTFVNERLARHYGIPNIYGSQFRRIPVTDEARKGLLGQASILTVTSYPNRTSVVLRGKWILSNVLGTPPPPPPPNVPPFPENKPGGPVRTTKMIMEEHRANTACANCHKMFDPIGFALENFDATGAWRDRIGPTAVDSSSVLSDGTKVDGVVGLRAALLRHPDAFVGTVLEKLMTYAIGRGVDYYDMPAIRKIARDSAPSNYSFASLILGVVDSVPFQMRVKAEPEAEKSAMARR